MSVAATALSQEGRADRPSQLWTAMSFGLPLPARVVRAIVVARLANPLEGHAAVRGQIAQAVAGLLDCDRLPTVPAQGNGGSGEILALGSLFFELSTELSLTTKERMALINGSPCAAALVADVALAGRRRIKLAEATFALVAEAAGAPDEHYAPELEQLLGDEHEAAALRSVRDLLGGSDRNRQGHQASVSLRILPRIPGAARRAQAEAERAATVSLSASNASVARRFWPEPCARPELSVLAKGDRHRQLPGRSPRRPDRHCRPGHCTELRAKRHLPCARLSVRSAVSFLQYESLVPSARTVRR